MNKSILLVDDNPGDVYLTRRTLRIHNITDEVVVANDGLEAINYLFGKGQYMGRDLSQMPSVILLDMRMPGMDGLEVLKLIRSNSLTKHLPVVVFALDKDDFDRINNVVGGPNAYVHKPLDLDQFTNAMIQLGISWLVPNEPSPETRD